MHKVQFEKISEIKNGIDRLENILYYVNKTQKRGKGIFNWRSKLFNTSYGIYNESFELEPDEYLNLIEYLNSKLEDLKDEFDHTGIYYNAHRD